MYFLIETLDQLKRFKEKENFNKCYIEYIGINDNMHPNLQLGKVVALYIYSFYQDKGFIFNISHPEAQKKFNFNVLLDLLNKYKECYTFDKRITQQYFMFNSSKLIDLQCRHYLKYNIPFEYSNTIPIYNNFYKEYGKTQTNKLIPVNKLYEFHEDRRKHLFGLTMDFEIPGEKWYNDVLIPTLDMLNWGIKTTNLNKYFSFESKFSLDKKSNHYGLYNPYTTTGRPANSFNNINLMALNKTNGERNCIIPKNDYILEIDYDGYHPRIIADLVGWEFSDESIHLQMARMYFNNKQPTQKQIKESKTLTFKQLYGGIFKEYIDLPFFKKTNSFINKLWLKFNSDGYITIPISGRQLKKTNYKNINSQKLFNYYIQALETEYNVEIMRKIFNYTHDIHSFMIMYVYDAFVFDIAENEAEYLIPELKKIIENDKFPVKIKKGLNYGELGEVDIYKCEKFKFSFE